MLIGLPGSILCSRRRWIRLPGEVYEALNLDGQGHVLHHMTYFILEDSVIIEASPLGYESLLKYLNMMVFLSDIQPRRDQARSTPASSAQTPRRSSRLLDSPAPRSATELGLLLLRQRLLPHRKMALHQRSPSVRHLNWPNQSR